MGYEFTGGLPFTGNLPFKGSGAVNGEPVNRTNAGYKTLGGFVSASDVNNSGLTAQFGLVVSSTAANDQAAWAIGCPAGYIPVGVIMADNGILGNEPAKATYILQDIPATAIYEGTYRMQSFTTTQTGSTATPDRSYQIIFRATSAGIGAAPIGSVEFITGNLPIPVGWAPFPGFLAEFTAQNGAVIECTFTTDPAENTVGGIPFRITTTLTSAAAATAVTFLPDSMVIAGRKVYVTNVNAKVNGGTAWATTATVTIQDTAAVAGVTYAVAGLTANAFLGLTTANVTVANPVALGTGFTASKGLQIVGNANGTGSDLVVTVTGFID